MMNNHFIGTHLPYNTNANTNGGANSYPTVDIVQAELVNEKLEYQNHRLEKNLFQQESYVRRYWDNENNKQIIINNEWSKYSRLVQDERWFLSNNHISRDGDTFYYQPNHNCNVISGTKEDIELEISGRNTFNLCIVDDINNIKEIRFETVYISIKGTSKNHSQAI